MLILSRGDVMDLLTLDTCIDAVERAFRLHAEQRTFGPRVLGLPTEDGGFHIKIAGLRGERSYFAAKTNANFPQNRKRFGLPLIQGIVLLCDAETGFPLALMDSMELTVTRTDPNLKGATASNSNKPATLENGVTVSVPPFVVEGERIRVNPTESKYIERVK